MKSKIDKELVKTLYISGLNAPEIAKELDLKSDSVKKCIERNLEKYKIQHKRARFKNKEVEKAINYEATKCMSDSTFIKRNPSIYRTAENGDIVVNAHEDTLPWDVPRILKNENNKELVNKRIIKSSYRKEDLLFDSSIF